MTSYRKISEIITKLIRWLVFQIFFSEYEFWTIELWRVIEIRFIEFLVKKHKKHRLMYYTWFNIDNDAAAFLERIYLETIQTSVMDPCLTDF